MNFHTIPFLASGNSLLKLKIQLKHTDASYGTCDVWNYALDWYQVVLGCLRVPKNVFAKLAMSEVKFSHRPKIDILKVDPYCTHFRQTLWVQLTWCNFGASTSTRKNFGPPQAFIKTVLVAKINLLLNPYTILGQRRFIIGAQKPIKAHWRNLWDMWYVKLCFKEFSSGFGYPEGT